MKESIKKMEKNHNPQKKEEFLRVLILDKTKTLNNQIGALKNGF